MWGLVSCHHVYRGLGTSLYVLIFYLFLGSRDQTQVVHICGKLPTKAPWWPRFFFISLHSRLASNSRSPLASASEYRNYKHEPPRPYGSIQFSGIGFVHIVKPQLLFFPKPFTVSDRNSEPAELILFPRLCEFDLHIVLGYLL